MERQVRIAGATWCGVLLVIGLALTAAVQGRALAQGDRLLLFLAQSAHSGVEDDLMFGITFLGSAEVSLVLALVATVLARHSGPRFWVPFAIFAAAVLLELAAKHVVAQPGVPRTLSRGPHFGADVPTPYSFPSGHVTRATMLFGWLALAAWVRRRRWVLLAGCTVLVWVEGFSRVYLGDHWPTDVAGGILLGGAGLALALALAPRAVLMQREGS